MIQLANNRLLTRAAQKDSYANRAANVRERIK